MKKHKLNKTDIKFFVIPFVFLFIVFGITTFSSLKMRINEILKITEESTINIAETYASKLLNSQEAYEIIVDLLDEKILAASNAVLLLDDNISDISLTDLAEKFKVDQINLFNAQGEIICSNEKEQMGWRTYEGHPVYNFIKSNRGSLVEEIRQDTVNGKFYKFGYVKRDDNTFVQIGVLADNIHSFTSKFDIQKAIEQITEKENIEQAYFVDKNFKIVASSVPEHTGKVIEDLNIREHILHTETDVEISSINVDDFFHACSPIFYNNEWIGTLSIVWNADLISSEIRDIIITGVFGLCLIILVIGAILYFAYCKNQSNIKIAYYDSLTGLPNAVYMEEYLIDEVKKSKQEKLSVLLLNCKNFKTLNTIYGFKYGDIVLKRIADNIKSVISPDNMLFRFNTDSFVLVINDYKNQEDLFNLAQNLLTIFNNPFNGETKPEYVEAEIAIFEVRDCNITVDKILQDATVALNYLVSGSHEHIIFFDQNMEADLKRKNKIENAMRAIISGIDKKSFYLEFQPKLDTKTNKITGFEALARMNIEKLGFISPLEFIEIAEKRLLIYDLGKHILKLACEFINILKDEKLEYLTVAVNLSVIQLLRDEFVNDVISLIKEFEIQPYMLEFEITESIFLDNFDIINKKLEQIKNLGISISLDDFGTGFSSFARLRDLNVDTVKIDQYFVSRISALNNKGMLTADIISMAHKIGLNVVAEGVESEEQRQYLEEHKCDILQGYLISKPLEYKKAIDFVRVHNQ